MFHEIYEIRDALVEGSGWSGSRPITVDAGESVTPSLSPPLFKTCINNLNDATKLDPLL